ncbi:hypothetical protein ACFL2O_11315 [Thermodesulfobacteriota bacterium]
MKDFISLSPMKILEESTRKELGPGNLGVFIARAGVGKTACLIHVALDKVFRDEGLIHVSLNETPEKVESYYTAMYNEIFKALNMEDDHDYRDIVDKNRMTLAFLGKSFQIERFMENLKNITGNLSFTLKALVIDGVDFENAERALFKGFKEVAQEFQVEIWFSALSHRHITTKNKRGIPYPCHELDDLFSIIVQLYPESSGILLKLLKDHDNPSIPDTSVTLDPKTFLVRQHK